MTFPRVLLLSAYDAISHRLWAAQCKQMLAEMDWTVVTAKARHFSWALRGRPLQWLLDEPTRRILQAPYDLVIATSTVDLAALFACVPGLARVPSLLYMHENQFVYPPTSHPDQVLRNAHRIDACMVQIYALLAATKVVFNSAFHRDSMLQGVKELLGQMPVKMDLSLLESVIGEARILGVPIESESFCEARRRGVDSPLTLVWNHRWEFDKAPQRFLAALDRAALAGLDFRLVLLGEAFGRRHAAYDQLIERHGERVLHQGMQEKREDYYRCLRRGDVIVSSALHDFQGLSMLEGAASGLWPLAPRRLAYPEIYPDACLYPSWIDDPDQEAQALCEALLGVQARRREGTLDPVLPQSAAQRFSPEALEPQYREVIASLLGACG